MHTFRKEERLSGKKILEELFQRGSSFSIYPFRCIWMRVPLLSPYPAQLAISVPKRTFKKSVDRNLIRRRIREAYRKSKAPLYLSLQGKNLSIVFVLIYTAKTGLSYRELEVKIILTLQRLQEEYEKSDK